MDNKKTGAPLHGTPAAMDDPSRERKQYSTGESACQGKPGVVLEKPSYWAVLPAHVRYDPELPASARLLYAEISSLTDARGFCYASNAYFERLYELSERTIIRLLKKLQAAGYIRIEDADGGKAQRKIYAGINPLAPPDKNVSTPLTKMSVPPDKNVTHINKDTNNNPPIVPHGDGEAEKKRTTPKWKPERFEAFWRYYPAIPDGNGHGRRPAKDRAARAWDKLRADDSEIDAMAAALRRLKESRQWKEGVGIPYASTWLNSRAWREEVEDLAPVPAASPGEEAPAWI